jgi:hypothetical protein
MFLDVFVVGLGVGGALVAASLPRPSAAALGVVEIGIGVAVWLRASCARSGPSTPRSSAPTRRPRRDGSARSRRPSSSSSPRR